MPPSKPPTRPGVTPEAWARLMAFLGPDEETAGREYMALMGRFTRFFALHGHRACRSAAEEVLDRVALHLPEDKADVPNMVNYCYGFAVHISQERLRKQIREVIAEQGFGEAFGRILDKGQGEFFRLMGNCLQELEEADRALLVRYYKERPAAQRTAHREALAREQGVSLSGLRSKIHRLRERLWDILEQQKGTNRKK